MTEPKYKHIGEAALEAERIVRARKYDYMDQLEGVFREVYKQAVTSEREKNARLCETLGSAALAQAIREGL